MTAQTPAPQVNEELRTTNKRKLIWGIICLVAPTALLIVTILAYAIVRFIVDSTSMTPADAETLVAISSPAWATVLNVVLYIISAISVITWLPGIVVGIILLSSRKSA